MASELARDLWDEAFRAGEAPQSLRALYGAPTHDELAAFAASFVVPTASKVRLALADRRDPAAWEAEVRARWPSPELERLLASAPAGVRRVIDTDGGRSAWLYLDDVQEQADELGPDGAPVMCRITHVPSGALETITRHTSLRSALGAGASPELAARASAIDAKAEGTGLWGVRFRGARVASLLWVSESRWRGAPALSRAAAASLEPPATWDRLLAVAERHGAAPYADAIDVRAEGGFDLTLGIMPRSP